jgi:8-oxo-dGTP pyrophosphatase MutT (NUDIX family)
MYNRNYVLCVAELDNDYFVFVEKTKPAWQAGLFNFPGGKIEPGETPLEACRREFREETGVDYSEWKYKGEFYDNSNEFSVTVYYAKSEVFRDCRTMTEENIEFFRLGEIVMMPDYFVGNILWQLLLAKENGINKFTVEYNKDF